jgi:hypothetical protein
MSEKVDHEKKVLFFLLHFLNESFSVELRYTLQRLEQLYQEAGWVIHRNELH